MDAVREAVPAGWEQTACPLCMSATAQTVVAADDPALPCQVVRCCRCGLCYTNPRPDRGSVGRFYPDDYTPHQYRPSGGAGRDDGFDAALAVPPPGGRLLDFGCGAGKRLQRARALGWQVTGIDVSPRAVAHVRERLGLGALVGSLPHPELRPGSFEAITMSQSLEHVHDPLAVLREAHRLLTPGGQVIVAVPNLAGLPFGWFGAAWIGLDLPRHLIHFEPPTLRRMLQQAGFRVARMAAVRHNSWLRHSARRAGATAARLLRYRLAASLAGWYCAARGRTDSIVAVGMRD